MNRLITSALLTLLVTAYAMCQEKEPHYVQVDGLVYDKDGMAIRYVNIISLGIRNGTDSDANGIFSLISMPGDTLLFTSVGYKPGYYILPDIIRTPRYSIDIEMQNDTIDIGSVLVLPWKTYGEFVHAVIDYTPPELDDLEKMERNLAIIERQIYANLKVTPEMGYRYAMNQEAERVITANQMPVNNLINPFAWAKFIEGLKNGLLRNEKSDRKKKRKQEDSQERS